MAGSIILMISHGYKVKENDDPIVDVVDRATEQFSLATEPGAFLVDVIPACMLLYKARISLPYLLILGALCLVRYVPEWFPGAGWKKTAASWARTLSEMTDIPHEFVKQQMVCNFLQVLFIA